MTFFLQFYYMFQVAKTVRFSPGKINELLTKVYMFRLNLTDNVRLSNCQKCMDPPLESSQF